MDTYYGKGGAWLLNLLFNQKQNLEKQIEAQRAALQKKLTKQQEEKQKQWEARQKYLEELAAKKE